ncbi:MAG: hypothetical protein A2020_09530 [Lentisphaerae bacterium GWF2_45_14]|nr:MAG: hypothetical protein A2020_09530 [Lentisphaerae bacterium GWF2_45_14]
MERWKKNLIAVWISQFLVFAGLTFSMPFIPFYIKSLGVESASERNFWIAMFAAAGYSTVAIFSPIWGSIADRFGRKIMLLRANFCNALVLPAMAFAPNVLVLVLLRVLMGIFTGSTSASQSLISSETPLARRGFAIGLLSSAMYSGTMVGCFLGGITVDIFGFAFSFITCGIIYLIAGLIVLFWVKEDFKRPEPAKTQPGKKHWLSGLAPLKLAWIILFLIMIMDLARQFDAPFFPLMVEKVLGREEGSATWTGIISSIAAGMGLIAGPVLGMAADRIGAPKTAIGCSFLAGIFMLMQGLSNGMVGLITGRSLMVFFGGGLDPVFQIWLAKSTPDKIRGVIFGWALSAKCAGTVIAAFLSGVVATIGGIRLIYVVGCVTFMLLIPLIQYGASKVSCGKNA